MNPEDLLERLEEALRRIVAATENVIASGEELTLEEEKELSEVMMLAGRRIVELRQQISSEEAPIELPKQAVPNLGEAPYPSSNINAFKYDPENQQLFVKFHGKNTADSGPTYSYQGIPEFIFDVFRRGAVGPKTTGANKYHAWYKGVTPSLGASMHALIKEGGYPYQKVA